MKTDLPPLNFFVTCDSKKVTHGTLFVAVEGSKQNGSRFVEEAINQGATKIIAAINQIDFLKHLETQYRNVTFTYVENPRIALANEAAMAHGYPAKKLKFIGITGTKGKSTTTHLIKHILSHAGHKTALIGGIKNKIGNFYLQTDLTTPNSDYLQAFFATCVEQEIEYVVMEVSSHALSQHRVHGIEYDVIGFTNLGHDHLDYYASMESYLNAKLLLFEHKKPSSKVFINLDHSWSYQVLNIALQKFTHQNTITMSKNTNANIGITVIKNDLSGLQFSLKVDNGSNTIFSSPSLVGLFNADNISMAISIALQLGINQNTIQEALESFPGTPGRLQLHTLKSGAKAFIDFAHNPSSMESVLKTLRTLTKKLIVVFGCGGDRDKTKRPIMGRIAATYGDIVIITEDNPRTEDRLQILRDVEQGIPPEAASKVFTIQDRAKAIAAAAEMAITPTDIVVILGKGHETYQIIGTIHTKFDDLAEIQKY